MPSCIVSGNFQPNTSALERQPILGLALQQFNALAHPQQQAYIFALLNHASGSWCTAQNDTGGLAA